MIKPMYFYKFKLDTGEVTKKEVDYIIENLSARSDVLNKYIVQDYNVKGNKKLITVNSYDLDEPKFNNYYGSIYSFDDDIEKAKNTFRLDLMNKIEDYKSKISRYTSSLKKLNEEV